MHNSNHKTEPMRTIFHTTILAASLLTLTLSSRAAVLFDSSGFEGPAYGLGNLAGQNGFDFAGSGTAATVQNSVARTGSQAVQLGGGTTTWDWPLLEYTPLAGEIVRVSFDVRRSAFTANNNFGYFIDVYSTSAEGGNRVARTGLVRTGTAAAPGSVQGLVTLGGASPGSYLVGSPLLTDTWYNFVMDMDFASDTFSVKIDGISVGSALPFVTPSLGIGDADIQISAVTGATDLGFIDNYKVETVVVPEPGILAFSALGFLALLAFNRKRGSSSK